MRMLLKKSGLCLLCLVITLSTTACGLLPAAGEDNAPTPTAAPLVRPTPVVIGAGHHDGVRFSDMTYTRPDTDAILSAIDELEEEIASGAEPAALLAMYRAVCERFNDAESAMSLAYLLYAFDVTESYYEQEYAFLQSALNAVDLRMTDVSVQLFESSAEAEQLVRSEFGNDYVETVYSEEALNSEAIQQLQDREVALINAYNLAANDFTFSDGANTYSFEDLAGISEDEEYIRLYALYISQLNAAVGEIFLDMLDVRSEIAEKLGYGSYAAYMYECYGRDYTLQDAQRLQEAVKTHIVPVYLAAYGLDATQTYAAQSEGSGNTPTLSGMLQSLRDVFSYFVSGEENHDLGAISLHTETYSQEDFLGALQDAAADFSPDLYASLAYMLQNDLYDFSVNPKKMAGSFTTYLSSYRAPFIFSQWQNSSYDVGTVIHELGHFTNYYRNPSVGWSAGDSLDLAEVDSQGLELLIIPYYERFYGELAPYAERELLINCMYALISGCMEDEFQQIVYASPDMTLEKINETYRQLAHAYGFAELYTYSGEEWVEIIHTFQSPMYYVSYAASMVPALALWELSQTDMDAAKTSYFHIVDRAPYAAFRETIAANGLPDAFAMQTLGDIAKRLYEQVC